MSDAIGQVRELVVERSGCPLHAWVRGPATAPLVVLVHGATVDHRMFETQEAPLLAAGYRVMTMDLRGHGQSQPIGRVPFLVSDLADDVLALVDAVAVDRFVAVGQSLGAYVAQDLVLRHPGRIIALGVIGATCTRAPISRAALFLLRSSLMWLRLWPYGHLQRLMAASLAIAPKCGSMPGRR